MADEGFTHLVSLACHDLRTPLATVNGASKLMLRQSSLSETETEARLASLIDGAAQEMSSLLDQLGLAARIASGRYAPLLREADSLALAASSDARVTVSGQGASVLTDVDAVSTALARLASAALRYGDQATVAWAVSGRSLALSPLAGDAGAVVEGSAPRDLGALVARMLIEALGGALHSDGGTLRVELG